MPVGAASAGCAAWQKRSSTASPSGSCSSTASTARKPLVQMAPEKASGQQGSASLAGSSGKATASTNITSSASCAPAPAEAQRCWCRARLTRSAATLPRLDGPVAIEDPQLSNAALFELLDP
ncbi:MAG: hypothetical protein NTW51_01160 [Cyanobacteria bacterium]|nr:hypothetical protein [Cyanobacteriota bacterium]